MQGSCLLDLFLLPVSSDHTDFIMEYNKIARAKELLIKTKSRSRKGEQQKHPQNMHAEYHYNPAQRAPVLRYKICNVSFWGSQI